jgi:hypothetical protein
LRGRTSPHLTQRVRTGLREPAVARQGADIGVEAGVWSPRDAGVFAEAGRIDETLRGRLGPPRRERVGPAGYGDDHVRHSSHDSPAAVGARRLRRVPL